MTEMQQLRRDRRNADIIAGAVMIIAALDDYQAAYQTATAAKARRHVYAMLDACGITMDDVQARRAAADKAHAEIACGVGRCQVRRLTAERGRWSRWPITITQTS